MMRVQRTVCYFVLLLFFVFISVSFLPQLKNTNNNNGSGFAKKPPTSTVNTAKKADPSEEKYLSWFPHSDFPEQQESFRNALRLAIETNRTIIAPMLRINKIYTWLPFEKLALRYEAQDKTALRKACAENEKNWRTELEPCETIDDWTEIPWSSIMDLELMKKDFGVRIIERTQGHGWGVEESALGGNIHPDDVTVVDVMSFKENGTDWEHADASNDIPQNNAAGANLMGFLKAKKSESADLTQPLKYVFSLEQLLAVDTKILQFGALNTAARYQTDPSPIQQELRKSMMKTHFVTPDQLDTLTQQSERITDALGGKFQYSTLILNIAKLVALDARAGTIQHAGGNGKIKEVTSIEEIDKNARAELMKAVVLEIFGDIPINQAVSSAMPIKPSKLATILQRPASNAPNDRRELLDACVDYHKNIEQRYPVYYLMNDMGLAPETRPDIFGPLLKSFPCVFSRFDMLSWGIQTDHWSDGQSGFADSVDYEKLLQPMLDILITRKAYSFFEIPTTPLTRFLNWGVKS
ncbi:hypothetical protein K501DRAFT_236438 [Backusella circina FSU 941]|nr:hypothetical protein K501DRAFT_236438 [Backusella circina FSU 941]